MDWEGLLRLGIVRLKLTPAEFWALTPLELMLMLGFGVGQAPLTRARLIELSRQFPDSKDMTDDDV